MLVKFSICDLQETSVFIKQIYIRVRLSHTYPEPLMMMMMMMMIVVLMVLCLV
jgi:hypothetical protein